MPGGSFFLTRHPGCAAGIPPVGRPKPASRIHQQPIRNVSREEFEEGRCVDSPTFPPHTCVVNYDISRLLQDWDFEQGQVVARRFKGRDGRDRIQLRVDLGILQMLAEIGRAHV